jgi:hypothetical protein
VSSIENVAARWRVVIDLDDAFDSDECKRDLAREMRDSAGVVVVGGPTSGAYHVGAWLLGSRYSSESPVTALAGDRESAEAAARVAQQVMNQDRKTGHISVQCWRPITRQWEDASAVSDRDLAEEHDYQQREDRRLSAETGVAQWRVRVDLRTHRDTVALARRLSIDGFHVSHDGTTVQASADCEGDALRLAENIRQLAPSGAEVFAERADAVGTPDMAPPGGLADPPVVF